MSNGKIVTKGHNNKRYKCPYCEDRLERDKMTDHVYKNHEDMIPSGYTAARVAFNAINKKETGSCIICKKETQWNETKQRYERICDNKKCMEEYKAIVAARLMNARGVTKEEMLSDPEFQNKMLNNRKISGTYKFADGGKISYVGSYERKFLEFMDVFLHVQSKDIQAPGPTIEYYYQGKKHFWITDFYYIPYNLVLDIKDGGKNPNNRDMQSYRSKQVEKEKAIREWDRYNYLRLTDNQFDQLIEMMLELKETMIDLDTHSLISYKPIIKINESADYERFRDRLVKLDYHYTTAVDIITNKVNDLISSYNSDPQLRKHSITLTADIDQSGTSIKIYIFGATKDNVSYASPIVEKIKAELINDPTLSEFCSVNDTYCTAPESEILAIYMRLNSDKVDMRPLTAHESASENIITNLVFDMGSVLIDGDLRQEMINDKRIPNQYVDDLIQYYWQAENKISETASMLDCSNQMAEIVPISLCGYIPYVLEDSVKCYKPFEYTESLLQRLKNDGYKLWYLSNWGKWHCEAVMENGGFDFLKYFDGGIFSYQVGYKKPDKRIYEEFFNKFSIDPTTACFYDDRIENIEAGKRLGMAGIEFTPTVCIGLCNSVGQIQVSESTSNECTGNAIVGGNMPESIYIVNYTKYNTFSGENEDHIGIGKNVLPFIYTFNNNKLEPESISSFAESIADTNIIVMKYIRESLCEFNAIINRATNEMELFTMLTGETDININSMMVNPDFMLMNLDFFDKTLQMKDTIIKEAYSLIDEPKCVLPVLESHIDGRHFNYYTDIDGFFIQNELTLERSASYSSIESIPLAVKEKYQNLF